MSMAISSEFGHRSNGGEPIRIRRVRTFIHEHADEELSLAKVAQVAHTSANYFSEKFKEATGTNFVKYVAQTRFEKAAALLRQSDLRVSEIAFASGFQSLSQFNRVFKKLSGTCPIEYQSAARAMKRRPDCNVTESTRQQTWRFAGKPLASIVDRAGR